MPENSKTVLIIGANSDVAKQCILQYTAKGFTVLAASRDLIALQDFIKKNRVENRVQLLFFDAVDFSSHQKFYDTLPEKPHIVLYAAGFLVQNDEAFTNFDRTLQMMHTNYCGAVSILNLMAFDKSNHNLERIVGLSSLSGVRGRKSNFVYGSTKSAFTTYLAGLRQEISSRNIQVNVFVLGYINSKINRGLELNQSLMMTPEFVADKIVNVGRKFVSVPNIKWKVIYTILKILPESLVARLP